MIKSVDNRYHSDHDEENNKRLYMKYDVTARRMGFKLDKENDVYYIDLN